MEVHLSPTWGFKKDRLKEMTHELNLEDVCRIREGKKMRSLIGRGNNVLHTMKCASN